MNTPSHFLMTMVTGKFAKSKPPRWALALGSIAPDFSLYVLTFGSLGYYSQFQGWTLEESFRHIFGELYFTNPYWIGLHNLLHAPILVVLFWICALRLSKVEGRFAIIGRWLCWFFAACLGHSVVDILTHFDDGPLILFPFDWNLRFFSPVSYWDPAHFGRVFSLFELTLDVFLTGLLVRWAFKGD